MTFHIWWCTITKLFTSARVMLLIGLLALSVVDARPYGVSAVDMASYIYSETGIKPEGFISQSLVNAMFMCAGIMPPESYHTSVPIYNDASWFGQDFKIVPANEILAKIQNNTPVDYDNIFVRGDLNLRQLDLAKKRFRESNLSIVTTPIHITHSVIFGDVLFNDTLFDNSVDFSWSKFFNVSDFDNSRFNSTSDFNITDFFGNAHFSKCIFNNTAGFVLSNFRKYSIFMGCTFNGTSDFVSSNFSSIADFSGAIFKENANFGS